MKRLFVSVLFLALSMFWLGTSVLADWLEQALMRLDAGPDTLML